MKTLERKRKYKIDEIIVQRNILIKQDFKDLKNRGVKNKDVFAILANKYFLSEGTINSIIYARRFNLS